MHIVISPAKNINFSIEDRNINTSRIRFEDESIKLLETLNSYNVDELMTLMKISPKLAQLNFQRFQEMSFPFEEEKTKAALLVFQGDVYKGMNVDSFSDDDLYYAQKHLSILSGFYGLLRPLDGIMPYRLEMGTHLIVGNDRNLYHFWNDKLQKLILQQMEINNDMVLVNLASNEYFTSLKSIEKKCRVITPVFKDYKNDAYKIISFYAKKARGRMAAFIIKNRIETPNELKLFAQDGYQYNEQLSEGDKLVFTRG